LKGDTGAAEEAPGHLHSTLEEVMEMVAINPPAKLVLGHFSARYSAETIDRRIRELCERHAIAFPVHRVLPGKTSFDILSQQPING
jgi:ribonuclease Z